eukprot:5465269-Alexandrium_andersonii.AAC.1
MGATRDGVWHGSVPQGGSGCLGPLQERCCSLARSSPHGPRRSNAPDRGRLALPTAHHGGSRGGEARALRPNISVVLGNSHRGTPGATTATRHQCA